MLFLPDQYPDIVREYNKYLAPLHIGAQQTPFLAYCDHKLYVNFDSEINAIQHHIEI